jgi:hypothetical protein
MWIHVETPVTRILASNLPIVEREGRSNNRWRTAGALKSEKPMFYSRSHDAVIRVYDDAGNVIETHDDPGDFKEW